MFNTNVDFIRHCLTIAGIPYEEPFYEVEYNKNFLNLFKEAVYELQKLVDFAFMYDTVEVNLPAGEYEVYIGKDVKYILDVYHSNGIRLKNLADIFYYVDFKEGVPLFYVFNDSKGVLVFDKKAKEDYTLKVRYVRYILEEDPHPLLFEAPEVLKHCFLYKVYFFIGDLEKCKLSYQYYLERAKLEMGLEKQKRAITTKIGLKWVYDGLW